MFAAGFFCFCLGIILIIVYTAVLKKHARCRAQTKGVLTAIRENTSRDTSRSEYYYSYTVDNTEYQFKTFDPNPETKNAGECCVIWYDPKKPKIALAHRYNSYKWFKLLLIAGILFIILGLFVFPMICIGRQAYQ